MPGIYTVTQVTSYIKNLFVRDFVLSRITVKGEVSNCKYHNSGHIYFTLKDRGAALSCVMFAAQRERLTFRLSDGQQIEAAGQIAVYDKTGVYQLYVRDARLSGAGELYERYLELKARLEEMGMFDPLYKQPIPRYCRRIGVVTALTGAAIQDIINVSKRRNPYVELVLCPAQVQGEGAAESIVRGIERLDRMGLDVLIVGRGGGSIEDLWAFNEEIVARAIFEAATPVISAVGHETDYTIADFVADARAATPSQAAELASFEYASVVEELHAYDSALSRALEQRRMLLRHRLLADTERLKRLSPGNVLEMKKSSLREYERRLGQRMEIQLQNAGLKAERSKEELHRAMDRRLSEAQHRMKLAAARLEGLSPLKKISGGYGYVADSAGRPVSSVRQAVPGQDVKIYMHDGRIVSRVLSAEEMGIGESLDKVSIDSRDSIDRNGGSENSL